MIFFFFMLSSQLPSVCPSLFPIFSFESYNGTLRVDRRIYVGLFLSRGRREQRTEDGRLRKAASKMGQSVTRKSCEGMCACVCLCVCLHTELKGATKTGTCAVTRKAKWRWTSLGWSDYNCWKWIGIDGFLLLPHWIWCDCILHLRFWKNPSHSNWTLKSLIEVTSRALVIGLLPKWDLCLFFSFTPPYL